MSETACAATEAASIKGRVLKRHGVGQMVCDPFRHGYEFSKPAHAPEFWRGDADDFAPITQIGLAAQTKETLAAGYCRVECNPIAAPESRYSASGLLHNARRFMAHDDGWQTPTSASVESMNIASADAACSHADQQFISRGNRRSYIHILKPFVSCKNECLHFSPPNSW